MATITQLAALFLCLLISATSSIAQGLKARSHCPCQELVVYFHDILFNGQNYNNATAVIVGSPQWGNKTAMAMPYNFGDMVVFDDPITLDNNLHSPPIGRAHKACICTTRRVYNGAWLGFSFLFNLTEHVGTLNFAGADPLMNKSRGISVIGGTSDFFMACCFDN